MRFHDRAHAGRVLAGRLQHHRGRDDVIVLALPRGGVPVAFEVAQALGAPLDIFLVRKLGFPGHEELAIGAIATGGVRFLDEELIRRTGVPAHMIEAVTASEHRELLRRERAYRGDAPPPSVEGKVAILVDDGLATGSSMRAAIQALKLERPAKIVVAVPVAPRETFAAIAREVDEAVCAATPEPFHAVGLWYADFSQTADEEVGELLARARRQAEAPQARPRAAERAR